MMIYKSLPAALKERESVEALKLNLKGAKFPPEMLDFPKLTELYLEGNCEEFPEIKNSWRELKVLSIKWPAFTGDLSSIFTLPAVENVKIIETPLKRFFLPLGFTSSTLSSLTVKDGGMLNLPEEISMITGLTELNLSGNELSRLPQSFPTLKNLRRLNLDRNKFSKFPDMVKTMPSLTHLSIDGNCFSEDEKERIQRQFHLWL
ncbi:MAG TPA: leucine-rich repeat domain-containing protein [Bacteriovoracaceae bacterium]|nr:leucine-rich repeat domain-containing protein [Bacteriovoracaceae bacterium]